MTITEIAFTCYAVNDLPKSRAFYEGLLGLKATSVWETEEAGFIEYEIGPHTLAIGKGAPNFKPGKEGATVALEADDLESFVLMLKEKKVKILMDTAHYDKCSMAIIEDPSGNQVVIHQRKKQAK
jgi:predicted enzyme related to lactoylglutathione lyase